MGKRLALLSVLLLAFAPATAFAVVSPFDGSPFAHVITPVSDAPELFEASQPAATLVVEPWAQESDEVFIAWASVGMSADEPCRLYASTGSSPLSQGDEGFGIAPVSSSDRGITDTFTLDCTARSSGQVIERTVALPLP